jgi:protease-4
VTAAVTKRHAPVVALVEGHGAIVTGRSRRTPFQGPVMGSDTVAAGLRAAREDDRVAAVVFRIDSPGGSYVASDTVWREVLLTREAGKPVVVSMGVLAGSGGYFVACPADVIIAQRSTLTGSIGVFGGKAVVSGLTERLGLTTDAVSRGRHSRMFSTRVGFSDDERERLARWLDAVYDDFVGKVAAGRGLDRDAVHEIARGRVWTGADAAGIGLVDSLGGLRDAVRIARERAGLSPDAPVRPAVHVPLLARLTPPASSQDPRAAASAHLGGWGDLAAVAASLGLPSGGPLTMPVVSLR